MVMASLLSDCICIYRSEELHAQLKEAIGGTAEYHAMKPIVLDAPSKEADMDKREKPYCWQSKNQPKMDEVDVSVPIDRIAIEAN